MGIIIGIIVVILLIGFISEIAKGIMELFEYVLAFFLLMGLGWLVIKIIFAFFGWLRSIPDELMINILICSIGVIILCGIIYSFAGKKWVADQNKIIEEKNKHIAEQNRDIDEIAHVSVATAEDLGMFLESEFIEALHAKRIRVNTPEIREHLAEYFQTAFTVMKNQNIFQDIKLATMNKSEDGTSVEPLYKATHIVPSPSNMLPTLIIDDIE